MDQVLRSVGSLFALLVTASTAAGLALPSALDPTASDPTGPLTIRELAQKYGDTASVPPAPAGLGPLELKDYWLTERVAHGRSIQGWLDAVHAAYNFDALPSAGPAPASLVEQTLRVNALVGSRMSPADVESVERQAAALDPDVAAAFGVLVKVVADAYAAQLPIYERAMQRLPDEFDLHARVLTDAEREEMMATAAGLVATYNWFMDRVADEFAAPTGTCQGPPLFSDPEGLVILGSECDNTYTRAGTFPDPVLLVDPAGDDTYLNSAGGADPAGVLAPGAANKLVLSVVADALGNDEYTYNGIPSTVQGAGAIGAMGLLLDASGDDIYFAKMTRTGALSILAGVQYYFDGGGQGYGFGGLGLQLDGMGNDVFQFEVASTNGRHIWAFAQGFGALGGLGLSSDLSGTDQWLSYGRGITGGGGFQGIYTQGTGFWAGVGIMTDTGLGNDKYENYDNSTSTDYYAQGFGAFFGLGILADDGGNDDYVAVSHAVSSFINPLLHCAYGTASLFGIGVMIDGAGDDRYYSNTIHNNGAAHTMIEGFGGIGAGVGVFVDVEGADDHIAQAQGSSGNEIDGRGQFQAGEILENVFLGEGANVVGFYLDAGGIDTYQGGPGSDASTGNGIATVWAFGADINAVDV